MLQYCRYMYVSSLFLFFSFSTVYSSLNPHCYYCYLQVWSVLKGERLLTLQSHTDGVTCLQFNDQVIVSGSYDKSVKLWDFSVCWSCHLFVCIKTGHLNHTNLLKINYLTTKIIMSLGDDLVSQLFFINVHHSSNSPSCADQLTG